jgi:hypothetical protein
VKQASVPADGPVIDLSVDKQGQLSPLSISFAQSDAAYTNTMRMMPCQLFFMLVVELEVIVTSKMTQAIRSFSYRIAWPRNAEEAYIDHLDIAALEIRFRTENAYLFRERKYEPKEHDVKQEVQVYICASFTEEFVISDPYLTVGSSF